MKTWNYNNRCKESIDTFIAKCKEIRTKYNNIQDNLWKKLEEKHLETIIVQESNIQNEIIQPTETEEKHSEKVEEQNYEEIIEFIKENFQNPHPENVAFIEELLHGENCSKILNKISNNLNSKHYLENICTAFLQSSALESGAEIFCSDFLYPALSASEYSRGVENSLLKCLDVIPRPITKYTLVPLLNGVKSCPLLNISKLNPEAKKLLLAAYLEDGEFPTPEWVLQILFNLFKSCNSRALLPDMIYCLVNSFREFPQNIQFGKLVHLVCQKFVMFRNEIENANEMKEKLITVLEYNETSFKNVCLGLLQK